MSERTMNWEIQDDGMIGQTLSDMQDPSVLIFRHAAAANNEAVLSKKWQGKNLSEAN